MAQTIVINSEARQYDLKCLNKEGKVVNIILMPGVNDVDKAEWDLMLKSDKYIKELYDAGVFTSDAKLDAALESLAGFKPGEAIKLVKDTFDLSLLATWAKGEGRPKVKEAIEAQLEILNKKDEAPKE